MRPQKSDLEGGNGRCPFENPFDIWYQCAKIILIVLLGTCWATIVQSFDSKLCVCDTDEYKQPKAQLKHKAGLRHELVWVHNHLISRDWPSSKRASKQKQSKSKVKCRTTISITQRGLHGKLTDIN